MGALFFLLINLEYVYLRPFLAAFFSSISCFLARRFGDLYGRGLVFFFGLNAMIRVIWALVYSNFRFW